MRGPRPHATVVELAQGRRANGFAPAVAFRSRKGDWNVEAQLSLGGGRSDGGNGRMRPVRYLRRLPRPLRRPELWRRWRLWRVGPLAAVIVAGSCADDPGRSVGVG